MNNMMELESLKQDWKNIVPEPNSKKILSDSYLSEITKRKLKSNKYKVIIPKLISSIPYLFGATFLFVFRQFFNSKFEILVAILAAVICILIPVINLFAISKYNKIVNVTSSVNETLFFVQKQGKLFIQLQYVVGFLSMLLITLLVVLVPLVYSEDLSTKEIIISQFIGLLIVAFFSKLIWNYYKRIINFNLKVLEELL